MNHTEILNELARYKNIFKDLLTGITKGIYLWKPATDKWCLLEVICQLLDEETEDFRARTKHVLNTPDKPLPPIDPQNWVISKKYIEQNFDTILNKLLTEREISVKWLSGPAWENTYQHPEFGSMTAKMFLCNWLAHDYLHLKQIIKLKYHYYKDLTKEDFNYAGTW